MATTQYSTDTPCPDHGITVDVVAAGARSSHPRPEVFAADVPTETVAVMAVTQRGASLATLSEPSGVPAWKTIPSWYLVANQDNAISPALERFMAARIHAHTVQIDSSHVAMISHPDEVTQLIFSAVQATT